MEKKHVPSQDILPGRVMYLDFDVTSVRCVQSFNKIYLMAAFLPYSRYLYGVFFNEPLTSESLTELLDDCFTHIGGVPEELEFDKERLSTVTKSGKSIWATGTFRRFAWDRGFILKLNQKGITHFMKTVKSNFAERTIYMEDWIWDESFADWLRDINNKPRRLNTKVVPTQRLELEQPFLQPLYGYID